MTSDSNIAWLSAATHTVASAAVLFLMRPALPPFTNEERIAYLVSNRGAWTFSWLAWTATALSLLAFYAVLAKRIEGSLSWGALAIGTAGGAIDIATHVRYIVTLPELHGREFALLDRELEAMTAYAANGMYTLGFVMFVIAGWRMLPPLTRVLAGPIAVSGFAMSVGALQHNVLVEIVSTAILFPLFIVWLVIMARWLRSA